MSSQAIDHSAYLQGFTASAAFTGKSYLAVKHGTTAGTVSIAGAGDAAVGILPLLAADPTTVIASGVGVNVIVQGGALAVAGATIAAGDYLKSDSTGKLTPVTDVGDFYVARATEAAVSGDYFSVNVSTGRYGFAASAVGTKAGTGVTSSVQAGGQKVVLTFTDAPMTLADNAGVVAYGSLKVFDATAGYLKVHGAVADLVVTKSSAGVNDNWDGDFSVGTAAASSNATLTGTEANIIPSTATPQAVSGSTTATGSNYNAITSLTDSTGGTASNTLAAVTNAANAGSADVTPVANGLASLAAKINELITATGASVAPIIDGHTTATDIYLNALVDDADHDVTGTACNLIFNGTLTLTVSNLGDN